MWDVIVSISDHCLSITSTHQLSITFGIQVGAFTVVPSCLMFALIGDSGSLSHYVCFTF